MKDEEFTVKCYEVPAGIDPQKTPWLYKYIQLHGGDVMSVKWGPSLGKYKTQEEVYKECIRRGVTWRELLDYKGVPDDVLL